MTLAPNRVRLSLTSLLSSPPFPPLRFAALFLVNTGPNADHKELVRKSSYSNLRESLTHRPPSSSWNPLSGRHGNTDIPRPLSPHPQLKPRLTFTPSLSFCPTLHTRALLHSHLHLPYFPFSVIYRERSVSSSLPTLRSQGGTSLFVVAPGVARKLRACSTPYLEFHTSYVGPRAAGPASSQHGHLSGRVCREVGQNVRE